jgi:hypothetical protein
MIPTQMSVTILDKILAATHEEIARRKTAVALTRMALPDMSESHKRLEQAMGVKASEDAGLAKRYRTSMTWLSNAQIVVRLP